MILEIILTILFILFLIPFIIFMVKLNKSIPKLPITANMPIVVNYYRKEFTSGYSMGTLKTIRKCKNGTSRIEFFPIDVEQGEDVKRPDVQSFIAKNEFIKSFGLGELSDYRQVILILTRNPLMIPEKMRNTDDGDYATREGQLAWLKSEVGKMISAGDEAIAEMMKDYARGNMTKQQLATLKETAKQFNESKIQNPEAKDEEKK